MSNKIAIKLYDTNGVNSSKITINDKRVKCKDLTVNQISDIISILEKAKQHFYKQAINQL